MSLLAFIDFYFLPQHALVGSLYAVPILIAAHRASRRMVVVTAVVSLAVFGFSAWVKSTPAHIWPYTAVGLIIIAYLGTRLAREIKVASARAAEAENARLRLRNFVSMVAHDLRGPLTVILGYAQVLARGREGLSPRAETAMTRLETEARRMNRLIQDMLDASQVANGRFELRPERVDLVNLTQAVLAEQQITTTRHHLVLDAPARVEGEWDPEQITQVLANLVNNAIKYATNGGAVRPVGMAFMGCVLSSRPSWVLPR